MRNLAQDLNPEKVVGILQWTVKTWIVKSGLSH
jgi:hypothetical protein